MIIHQPIPKRRASKPTKAQRELAAAEAAMLARHARPLERGRVVGRPEVKPTATPQNAPPPPKPPDQSHSLAFFEAARGASTARATPPKYEGEAIGLATMHKSTTTLVYTREDAVSIARMRR